MIELARLDVLDVFQPRVGSESTTSPKPYQKKFLMNTSTTAANISSQVQFDTPEFGSAGTDLSSSFLGFDCPVPYELHMLILVLGLAIFLTSGAIESNREKVRVPSSKNSE